MFLSHLVLSSAQVLQLLLLLTVCTLQTVRGGKGEELKQLVSVQCETKKDRKNEPNWSDFKTLTTCSERGALGFTFMARAMSAPSVGRPSTL